MSAFAHRDLGPTTTTLVRAAPIACCTQEGTLHPSPFLWDWLNWLLCPFDNLSGALHEKHQHYIRLRATIRPLGSDSLWTPPSVRKGLEMKKILFFVPDSLQMVRKHVLA